MTEWGLAARGIDTTTPNVAARDNRSCLGRVVRYLATQAGIRQFLDLGGGLATQANVHELAQGVVLRRLRARRARVGLDHRMAPRAGHGTDRTASRCAAASDVSCRNVPGTAQA
jgi:S-adenosyl methyltransferase